MLWTAFALAFFQSVGPELPEAWERFDGAGVSLEAPAEFLPGESVVPGAYLFDLRRESGVDDAVAFLRVAMVGPATPPESLAGLLRAAADESFAATGEAFRSSGACRAVIAGAEREGEKRIYADEDGVGWDLEIYAFPLGGLVAAVVRKTYSLQREDEGLVHSRLLEGLELRPISGSEPILFRLARTGVRLPGMISVQTEQGGLPSVTVGRASLPVGVLTFSAQDCRYEDDASVGEQVAFTEIVDAVQRDAEASSGRLVLDGHASGLIAAGGRVLPFRRVAVSSEGNRVELLCAVVRDGSWLFALQLAVAEERVDEAAEVFRELLASLDFAYSPPPTRPFLGLGLRFELPALMWARAYCEPQFIIHAAASHVAEAELPAFYLEWRDDVSASQHEAMHQLFREELFPGRSPSGSETWTVPGPLGEAIFLVSLLGERGSDGLIATAARPWRGKTLVLVLTMPRARNAVETRGALEHVVRGMHPTSDGEAAPLRSGPVVLDLPDGDWIGWEKEDDEHRAIAVAARWGEFQAAWAEEDPEERMGDAELLAAARLALGDALAAADARRPEGARVEDWIEIPGLGRAARVRQELSGGAFAIGWCARARAGSVSAWARTVAKHANASGELDRLLAGLAYRP